MIKVNLLTQAGVVAGGTSVTTMGGGAAEEESSSQISPEIRNQALSKLLVATMPVIALYLYSDFYHLPELRESQTRLSTQVRELETFNEKNQSLTEEITKIKQDQTNIQTRIKTIQKISNRRFDEVKMIEALQQMMVERVFLVSLTYKQGSVNLSGYGETFKDVIEFQDQLQKSALLRDVLLVQQKDETLNEQTVKQFEISFRLEENL